MAECAAIAARLSRLILPPWPRSDGERERVGMISCEHCGVAREQVSVRFEKVLNVLSCLEEAESYHQDEAFKASRQRDFHLAGRHQDKKDAFTEAIRHLKSEVNIDGCGRESEVGNESRTSV